MIAAVVARAYVPPRITSVTISDPGGDRAVQAVCFGCGAGLPWLFRPTDADLAAYARSHVCQERQWP